MVKYALLAGLLCLVGCGSDDASQPGPSDPATARTDTVAAAETDTAQSTGQDDGVTSDSRVEGIEGTGDVDAPASEYQVTVVTSMGAITIDLNPIAAPVSTENFLTYAQDGFYDGDDGLGATTFHRVIAGFMIQGGGITESGTKKQTHPPIVNESGNGLLNIRGSVAMARTSDPDSATSQFFINHVDNSFLDPAGQEPGYAVFGQVVSGMDVVDAIAAVQTDGGDVPLSAVLIEDVLW